MTRTGWLKSELATLASCVIRQESRESYILARARSLWPLTCLAVAVLSRGVRSLRAKQTNGRPALLCCRRRRAQRVAVLDEAVVDALVTVDTSRKLRLGTRGN